MSVTDDSIMFGKNDEDVSPYLRRPLRSLGEYLKQVAQRRKLVPDPGQNQRPKPATEDGSRGED